MVTILTVTCPDCAQVSDIHLSSDAGVVILNCPNCSSPVMYFDNKIYLLSPNQIEAIRNSARESDMMNVLQKIVYSSKTKVVAQKSSKYSSGKTTEGMGVIRSSAEQNAAERGYISDDDLINLRIELERCTDSKDFIDKL
ncbi:hypothetical protein CHISP_3048 [Chitinispirillum alkaliphilum]|nr:hypothetical protein CHISP_3048 [Chitinispirillum alkaliphilum]